MRKSGTMLGFVGLTALVAGFLVMDLGAGAQAGQITGTGTRVEDDLFKSSKHWGRDLSVPENGQITRVMGGTYGFQILNADEEVIGDFLFPDQAVGFSIPAGEYTVRPLVCRIHRHHHVEVTVEY